MLATGSDYVFGSCETGGIFQIEQEVVARNGIQWCVNIDRSTKTIAFILRKPLS